MVGGHSGWVLPFSVIFFSRSLVDLSQSSDMSWLGVSVLVGFRSIRIKKVGGWALLGLFGVLCGYGHGLGTAGVVGVSSQ
jgi:hypothetical protein